MPGSPHSTAPPPTLTACRIDRPTERQAQLRDVFSFLHALMGNLAPGRRCVFEQRLPVLRGIAGSPFGTFKKYVSLLTGVGAVSRAKRGEMLKGKNESEWKKTVLLFRG